MKTYILLLSAIILFLAGCKKEYELKKSVYISDPDFPNLPAYSEWGYNTFGAFYDRDVFISNNKSVPAKVITDSNSISFILDGQKGDNYYYYYEYVHHEMIMTFNLSGIRSTQYSDLTKLNDTIIDLTNPFCQVSISIDSVKYNVEILSGELNFKRAQFLQVDEVPAEVILSGYFECKAVLKDQPFTISDGRFDVGISTDNYYNY